MEFSEEECLVAAIGGLLVVLTMMLCYIVLLCFQSTPSTPAENFVSRSWPKDALFPVGSFCLDPWMGARNVLC